jgi:PAS domain S-box-containing protein
MANPDTAERFDPLLSFLEGIAAMIVIFQEGKVVFANQNIREFLKKNELIGMSQEELVQLIAQDTKELSGLLERAEKSGQARPRLIKLNEKLEKGKERIAYTRYFKIGPRKYATALILMDPESFWDIETTLVGKPQRFMAMLDSMKDWIWEIDSECVFTYSNRASERILGMPPEELIGKNINDVLSSSETEQFIKELSRSFPSDKELIVYRLSYTDKAGKPHYMELEVFPIFDEDGLFAGFRGISRDVTKEHLSLQRVKLSEKKYKTLFEGANDAIFLMNNYVFQDCNAKTLEMFGCNREDIIGKHPWEFSPEKQPDGRDSREKAIEMMDKALTEPQRFYWKHRKKDGTLFDAEVSLNRLKLSTKGKMLQAIVRDVTEKFEYEARLEESAAKFRTLFEQSPDVRMVTDSSLRIVEMNDAALNALRLKREEVIGKRLGEVLPERLAEDFSRMITQVLTTKEMHRTEYHLQLEGLDCWLDLVLSPIPGREEKVCYVLSSGHNVTPRKLAEINLSEQKNKLQLIQDNIDFGVMVIDRDFKIVEMNRQLSQWSPNTKAGDICRRAFEHCKFADKDAQGCPGERVFSTKKPYYESLELECDGQKKFFEFRSLPIFDEKGEVKYVMEIIDDVTEKNLINRQLDMMRKRAELYVDLMAHDIVNYITPVNCYLDFLLSSPDLSDEHRELIRHMFEQLSKTSSLIKNVRTMGEAYRLKEYIETQDLKELIENAERDAMSLFPWKNIKFTHSFPDGKCAVDAHKLLMNALSNVYQNSIKADAHDEVVIDTIVSRERDASGEYYLIRIDDRGHGIPEEQKKALLSEETKSFESMYSERDKRTSRGMGLRLIRMIVELSGGSIDIEDRVSGDPSQGTSFRIRLPIKT